MPKPKKETKEAAVEVDVIEVRRGVVEVCVIGRSPLICNRVSEKAKRELLFPGGRKNATEKAITLKHDPLEEFRDSPYRNLSDDGPTRLQALSSWFKKAMMSAALDLPGTKRAQIGRLIYTLGDRIDLYGTPQIFLAVTRNSDIGRTPDVRSRAILPRWACFVRIAYSIPIFNDRSVVKLAAAGGHMAGVGDWRIEKGSGSYGQYELVSRDDPEFNSILKEGRKAQDAALVSPVAYDDETESLLAWFGDELVRRTKDAARKKEVSIDAA